MGVLYVSGEEPSFFVGRSPQNDLVLEDPHVSGKHLRFITVTNDTALVEIFGRNGALVGGRKVKKGYKGYIRVGERITVGGYDLVWTGRREAATLPFIRSSAMISEPEMPVVEIEGPPQRKVPEKPSIMLAAGPALTMAIPILLGAGKTIAVLSSLFAGMWAAFNVTGRIRKLKTEEQRRRNAYMTYLSSCEEEIKRRIEEVNITLNRIYPSVTKLLGGASSPFLIWAQKADEDGNLYIRTGTGAVPNPVRIKIPRERFAAIDDFLRDMPSRIQEKYEKLSSSPVRIRLGEKDIPAYVIGDEKGRQMLASAILQLAGAYPPEEIRMMLKLGRESMRYYMWACLLPHFVKDIQSEEAGIREGAKIVMITDDIPFAWANLAEGKRVIIVCYRQEDIPEGMCTPVGGARHTGPASYDMIPRKLCFSYAGKLAALWGAGKDNDAIPPIVPFGRLFEGNIGDIIRRNHEKCDIRENIAAPLGFGPGGRKVFLDLHEKAAGPHGVIAGTTGSGKSELLTTMILSFSMCYPPEKLAFFLIDYKGGGMSNLFDGLPHLTGSISNLSKEESQRAMIALGSENIRRQEIFARSGVNNINDYTRLYDEKAVTEPLPHIFIIVDEFAELKKEEPEFMDRLISISQVGRSLGMHLILATQKPAGVVDDKIRSNSGFRIALRMVDRTDSTDLLQRCDAIFIKERGRALLQTGNRPEPEPFQSGYAMGHVKAGSGGIRIYRDHLLEEEVILPDGEDEEDAGPTWYELCMKELVAVYEERGIKKSAGLWLPLLPEVLDDEEAFAVFDDPYRQRYEKVVYDPERLGHLLVAGRSKTGKTGLILAILERLAGSMAVYLADYGGGRLKGISGCWCGGYTGDDDPEDLVRMTGFIEEEVSKRRKTGVTEPKILLVLDDMPDIIDEAGPDAAGQITRILTLGKSAGVFVLATAPGIPSGRIYELFDTRMCMGNEDPYTVSSFLGSCVRDVIRITSCPGRGLAIQNDVLLEFQTVRYGIKDKSPPDAVCARRYPHVPGDASLEEFMERAVSECPPGDEGPSKEGNLILPAGYDVRSGKLYHLPLSDVNCVIIAGKQYSGRHTFLSNISITAARYGIPCIRADTYESLISACRMSKGGEIITVNSVRAVLDDFYSVPRSADEEKELAMYLENPRSLCAVSTKHPVIIAMTENEARTMFSGRMVFEAMIAHPYGISFGGCLDENRILDYSYLSYSAMQMSQCRYFATVLKFDENSYFGNIKIPGKIKCG